MIHFSRKDKKRTFLTLNLRWSMQKLQTKVSKICRAYNQFTRLSEYPYIIYIDDDVLALVRWIAIEIKVNVILASEWHFDFTFICHVLYDMSRYLHKSMYNNKYDHIVHVQYAHDFEQWQWSYCEVTPQNHSFKITMANLIWHDLNCRYYYTCIWVIHALLNKEKNRLLELICYKDIQCSWSWKLATFTCIYVYWISGRQTFIQISVTYADLDRVRSFMTVKSTVLK